MTNERALLRVRGLVDDAAEDRAEVAGASRDRALVITEVPTPQDNSDDVRSRHVVARHAHDLLHDRAAANPFEDHARLEARADVAAHEAGRADRVLLDQPGPACGRQVVADVAEILEFDRVLEPRRVVFAEHDHLDFAVQRGQLCGLSYDPIE
ncbi:hypothetical protein [Nocardia brasiliensis]|uniref:hypothetical protein n=1 Tax=Nocardia brasiliensis TaxID=37326 RepID=UPI001892E87E|nr:hypothetical protein [Nocardia brasiliensis]MBF6125056.1 hypothetical protein [Nocardia brasiliensis]